MELFYSQVFTQEWTPLYGLIFLTITTVVFFFLHRHFSLPVLRLMSQWLRWLTFACFFSWIIKSGFGSLRPDWLHFVTGLAIWFMIETLINRISIQLLNFSDIHLFPSYTSDSGENLWPIQSRAMHIKKILSEKDFRSIGIVKAQVHGHLKVRQALFLDADKAIRLGVVFIPNAQNRIQLYFSLCSVSESGKLYITDNQNMPFGGYYPEHWSVRRYPLCHSLNRLILKHRKRMNRADQKWLSLEEDSTVVHSLNDNQRELERKNRQMGFLLYPKSKEGKQISSKGCFRIWTEMWLLAYLGKTLDNC